MGVPVPKRRGNCGFIFRRVAPHTVDYIIINDISENEGLTVQWTDAGTGDSIQIYVVVNSTGNYYSVNSADDGYELISAASLRNLVRYLGPGSHPFRVEVAAGIITG